MDLKVQRFILAGQIVFKGSKVNFRQTVWTYGEGNHTGSQYGSKYTIDMAITSPVQQQCTRIYQP